MTKMLPLILSGYSNQPLAKEIAATLGTTMVDVKHRQFDDGEVQITLDSNIRGREIVVVASAAGDPNKQEKEARLLMSTARRGGAASITLLLPYMWYGRADGVWNGRRLPVLVETIEMLRMKCDNVIVADPHNANLTSEKFLDSSGPVKTCSIVHFAFPYAVQLKDMMELGLISKKNLLFTHADAGSVKRIDSSFRRCMYEVLGFTGRDFDSDDWAQGFKDRNKRTDESRNKGVSLSVKGKDVVIFEDMVASGGTACKLAAMLKKKGARSVILFATSGLFTPDLKKDENPTAVIERINDSCIDALFITDTYDYRRINPEMARAIADSCVIYPLKTATYLAAIVGAVHMEVTAETGADENSIMALLNGVHPAQTALAQKMARPVTLKPGNRLAVLAA